MEFDVTMGAKHSAECTDLIGLYKLNEVNKFIDKEKYGLYRDDFLGGIEGSGPKKIL